MQLDLRGQECPDPTLKAVAAMKKSQASREVLVVITDDPTCAEEIPFHASRLGYLAHLSKTGSTEWTIRLTYNGGT